MPNIEISVIIPVYNGEKTILRALASLRRQTMHSFEIIVIDDGSLDQSGRVAGEYLESINIPFRILVQKNGGVSSARNAGLRLAQGKYVFFLDADDHIHPECLERLLNDVYKHNADMVFCGFNRVDEDGGIIRPYTRGHGYLSGPERGMDTLMRLLNNEIDIWMAAVLYKRRLLADNNIYYTEGCIYREDFEFQAKALYCASKVVSVPEVLSYYVIHSDSTTGHREFYKEAASHELAVFLRLKKYFKRPVPALDEVYIPHAVQEVLFELIKMGNDDEFLERSKSSETRGFLKRALNMRTLCFRADYFFKSLAYLYFPKIIIRRYRNSND